ncbi:putative Mitogen-activated kinase kinase kinase [Trypanosoma cruzi]|uniref:non-specific serine/threonine protein kinase n=2 Tax=Trypanosoma cruzi TaxID=5693 RepID=Q4DJA8_TRYCC|nr:protein kinase, putative [Trypanosoma cruzi]EAN92613.1 protein kinase, putative [Trypanosoma cruzi]PWV15072.1 putative Mitogen-activated kinase kinase kinase [Trypanosoma cruzi]|eukprot:XP_814464.1 protein kinase [Trypanosoma cruzi strain CL Brener]
MSGDLLEILGESRNWVLKRHRVLGKGGFGCATLYEEVHTPGSFVVVKDINMQIMKKEEEMKAVEMEVAILRRSCGHPNIVQFLDYYHDGQFMMYIVMEYCEGGDLARLEEQMQFRVFHQPERFVASILIQMLVGLYYLHVDQHTLHRDIKPQNVFLCSDGTIRIGDFGVSTVLNQYGCRAKAVCGSPFYMAPELCEEKAYDGKADLWSLGVMMYELMVLERPFNAKSIPALTRQIIHGEFSPIPRELHYSAQLVEMVESFLQTSPTARPTLRRVLRSSYVHSHLDCVPIVCLLSDHYARLFGEELLQQILQKHKDSTNTTSQVTTVVSRNSASVQEVERCKNHSDHSDSASAQPLAHQEISELEQWLEANGDVTDAFIDAQLPRNRADGQELSNSPSDIGRAVKTGRVFSDDIMDDSISSEQGKGQQAEDDVRDDFYEDDFESESSG